MHNFVVIQVVFYQEQEHQEDITKQETPGVEESAVVVVECTTVKEEIKEENMDTEDPLSVQGKYQSNAFISDIYFYKVKHQFSITCNS